MTFGKTRTIRDDLIDLLRAAFHAEFDKRERDNNYHNEEKAAALLTEINDAERAIKQLKQGLSQMGYDTIRHNGESPKAGAQTDDRWYVVKEDRPIRWTIEKLLAEDAFIYGGDAFDRLLRSIEDQVNQEREEKADVK